MPISPTNNGFPSSAHCAIRVARPFHWSPGIAADGVVVVLAQVDVRATRAGPCSRRCVAPHWPDPIVPRLSR